MIEKNHILLLEGVYVTTGNPAFCLFLYLTGINFRGELLHGSDVSQEKIKCRPIRTREIGGISLSDVLYVNRSHVFRTVRIYNGVLTKIVNNLKVNTSTNYSLS